MGWIGTRQLASGGLTLAALLLVLVGLAAPSADAAERVLDPKLSLIGRCAEPETLDPVEDPGCPTTPPLGSHPSTPFAAPNAVTTDFYGDIYVSNFGKATDGSKGRIDVFSPEGRFISELAFPSPSALAVDSQGNLYVIAEFEREGPGEPITQRLLRFEPTVYEPEAGHIEYSSSYTQLAQPGSSSLAPHTGIAINPANDHLFANYGGVGVVEYDSAENGNSVLTRTPESAWFEGIGVTVDASRGLLYVTALEFTGGPKDDERIDIFDLNQVEGTPPDEHYKKIGEINSSASPEPWGPEFSIAVDEATGDIFVLDAKFNRVYQYAQDGTYLGKIEHGFQEREAAQVGIDNGPFSPNQGYLYVPSGKTGTGHVFAFEESQSRPPVVVSVAAAGISRDEAELQATVNPGNLNTSYTFEYTTAQAFEERGFEGAAVAGSGEIEAENLDQGVSAPLIGLQPGTKYRFRIVVTNQLGTKKKEGSFSTYPTYNVASTPCENQLLRTGFSALLPDCRAYELVTPANTNGRTPVGAELIGPVFTTRQAAPDGSKVPFRVEGGTLPGGGGTGSYQGDPFLSTRGTDGWSTAYIGPTGAEAVSVLPGGTSPDMGYSFWTAEGEGSALIEGRKATSYLRFPDGHAEVLGKGSIGTDPEALGLLISEGGSHVIFGTGRGAGGGAVQIEPDAAPSGTAAIYDRTPDGAVHVVSLLPGNQPLDVHGNANYLGASLDGEGVVFMVGNKLYLRFRNEETFLLSENVDFTNEKPDFAGISEGGRFAFYREGGRLWRFDAETGEKVPFSTGEVTPVIISADGSTAYFVSTSKLSSEPNPNGAFPQTGQQNLYISRSGEVRFVGIVTERDVVGRFNGARQVDGLGLWMKSAAEQGRFGGDPARTTSDGSVLLFQSRAPLDGYDPEERSEIYRYDSVGESLQCLSCNPTDAGARGDATLQSENREPFSLLSVYVWLQNLSPDGRRAIFQSKDPLVPGDTDGKQDVYEWEADGTGGCATGGGCIFLISSGHSSGNDYLYAVSQSGDDVFFLSGDRLLAADEDETPSIYDARVGGGFPEPADVDCQGEGCRPQLTPGPPLPGVQTPVQGRGDNVRPPHRCRKGQRKIKRGGKVRCVKKKGRHKQRHRRAGSSQKGGAK